MNLIFAIAGRRVLVDSLYITQLHGGIIEMPRSTARKKLSQLTDEAVDRFMATLRSMWGTRNIRILSEIPRVYASSSDAEVEGYGSSHQKG